MKDKFTNTAAIMVLVAVLVVVLTRFHRRVVESWAMEFPVEGLVLQDDGAAAFEQVVTQDRRMLRDLGFPKALRQLHAHVRHLVIHMDCHYFFTTDGRVLVMTLGDDGETPRLLETKPWKRCAARLPRLPQGTLAKDLSRLITS